MDGNQSAQGGCTHDCHTCSTTQVCDTDKKGVSFFATLNAISDHTDKISDDELMKMLQETVDEWEKEK